MLFEQIVHTDVNTLLLHDAQLVLHMQAVPLEYLPAVQRDVTMVKQLRPSELSKPELHVQLLLPETVAVQSELEPQPPLLTKQLLTNVVVVVVVVVVVAVAVVVDVVLVVLVVVVVVVVLGVGVVVVS